MVVATTVALHLLKSQLRKESLVNKISANPLNRVQYTQPGPLTSLFLLSSLKTTLLHFMLQHSNHDLVHSAVAAQRSGGIKGVTKDVPVLQIEAEGIFAVIPCKVRVAKGAAAPKQW